MTVLGAVPANVTRVAALKTAPVLQLPLLLLHVLVFVVFLLLDPAGQTRGEDREATDQSSKLTLNHHSSDKQRSKPRLFSSILHLGYSRAQKASADFSPVFFQPTHRQPASLRTVLHVVSDLPADPAASVVGRQLAVCQHLGVKEVVLQQKTARSGSPLVSEPPNHG